MWTITFRLQCGSDSVTTRIFVYKSRQKCNNFQFKFFDVSVDSFEVQDENHMIL